MPSDGVGVRDGDIGGPAGAGISTVTGYRIVDADDGEAIVAGIDIGDAITCRHSCGGGHGIAGGIGVILLVKVMVPVIIEHGAHHSPR